jgi:hypothetical protein
MKIELIPETKEQCKGTNELWGCRSGTVKCRDLCENQYYKGFEIDIFKIVSKFNRLKLI